MAERVGGSEFCTLPKFRTPTLSALPRTIGVLPLSLSLRPTGRTSSAMKCAFIVARHPAARSGDVSGRFHCPSPRPYIHLRRHFGPFPLPGTSGRKSPATFPAFSVARHLRPFPLPVTPAAHPRRRFGPFPSPVTSGRFRRPSPPAAHLRRRFGAFPLPVTSGSTSPATFRAVSVARHLRP